MVLVKWIQYLKTQRGLSLTGKIENHYKSYLTNEMKLAKELFFANKSYKHIAERLGRTEAAIKDLFKRMGMRRYRKPTNPYYTKVIN